MSEGEGEGVPKYGWRGSDPQCISCGREVVAMTNGVQPLFCDECTERWEKAYTDGKFLG